MTFQDFFSRLKRKPKALQSQGKSAPGRSEGNTRVGPTISLPQPKSHVGVAEDRGNFDTRTGESDDNFIDSNRGGVHHVRNQQNAMGDNREDYKPNLSGPGRTEVGSGGGGLRPGPRVGVVGGQGNVSLRIGESNSMQASPDHGGVSREKNQRNTVGHSREAWKSTMSATAKLVLYAVRDSADAFPPLKSVAGGLCSILENFERTQENKQAIESLAPRIKSLAESLCAPVPKGDTREEFRKKRLEQKLEGIRLDLTSFAEQGKVEGFLNNVGNAGKLGGLLEDIREAMMEYQTSLQQDIYDKSCRLIESVDLALLNGMHHITGAGHLSESRQGCLKGTRRDVLWQIESWLGDETDQRVFWLNGLAGTGKSTIAQTFAKTSFADGKLGASFFCSRDSEDRGNIHNIFPTLAFQLAYRYPEFRKELLPVLRVDPEIGQDSLCSQLEKVIIGPFKATRIQTLIIIDALDECRDEEPASAILSVLSRYTDQIPWVKFFITGRPEPRIRTGFRLKLLRPITEVLKLHDVERSSVDADIKLFLKTRLAEITKTRSDCNFTESWPSSYDIDVLCKKSAGLFIYASTVVKFVAAPYDLPTERLTLIISLPQSTTHEGRTGIDLLYTQVLEQAFHDADDAQELYTRFKLVLGAVLLVFYPLSTKTLSELLEKCDTPSHISNALRSLHSLLLVPNGEDDTVRPFHKSFPDFLTNPRRCKDERFFIDPPVHHIDILFSCLGLMKERLRKNICDLDGCPLLSDVKDLPDRRTAHIGSALEYSCRFWTKHLSETRGSGPHIERVKAAIDEFFTTHLLFWIEVLSITGHLNHGIYALNDIDRWYLSTGDSCEWTNDSQRLILSSFDSIRDSPTYVYRHVLPFCPSSSWLHKRYTSETLREVKVIKGHPERWETTTRVVSFRHHPNILVHRKDMIAVGLGSGDITILDAITGSTRSVLSAQNVQSVMSLALSMDGTLLVSGHFGDAIKLWDIQTGGVLKTFHGRAHSISISPDAILIASGSTRDIRLWDVRTGGCRHTIDIAPAPDGVTCLEFLPTVPGRLVSVSNGLVQQWDTNSNKAGFTASGHHVDFSSDGKHFVLCDEGPPTVRDTISGTTIATLRSPGQAFSRCSFSPSDEFVAGVAGLTVYVWNVTGTPRLIETFTPDTSGISSLAYSFSLISMHIDGKIRLRRIDNNSPDSAAMDTTSSGSPQANIVQTTLQEGSTAISVDSIGTIHLWDLSTGLSEILLQIPEIENVGSARMVGDTLIIVHRDRFFGSFWEVSTWDAKAKRRLQRKRLSGDLSILDPTPDSDLGISKDGATFFAVNPYVIRTWSTLTGESTGSSSHRRHTHTSTPLSIDLDGPMIWIRSLGQSQAWGCDLRNLKKITLELPDIPKRLRLACLQAGGEAWGNTSYSRIIDVTSQTEVFRLPGRFAQPGKVVWDGRYLFAVYETGELLILDFSHMTLR